MSELRVKVFPEMSEGPTITVVYAVVETDAYGRDNATESFVGPKYITKFQAEAIAKACNDAAHKHHHRYWKVVEMPYSLGKGFEP